MAIRPTVFIPKTIVDETLNQPAVQGKRMLEPFHALTKANKLPIDMLEDTEVVGNVEIHRHEGDLWFCLEGEATFICDGKAKDPKIREKDGVKNDLEIRATEIVDGKEYVLKAGDWLWIPPGQPHIHKADATARLVVIKVPTTEPAPLEECM